MKVQANVGLVAFEMVIGGYLEVKAASEKYFVVPYRTIIPNMVKSWVNSPIESLELYKKE